MALLRSFSFLSLLDFIFSFIYSFSSVKLIYNFLPSFRPSFPLLMEFSSIWFFWISSLASLAFLTIGKYCLELDKVAKKVPNTLLPYDQIHSWIASSVLLSISYAFVFRPPLENQELRRAASLPIFTFWSCGTFANLLVYSPLFLIMHFWGLDKNGFCITLLIVNLTLFFIAICGLKFYGDKRALARFSTHLFPLLIYPYHCFSWVSFISLLFLSLHYENLHSHVFSYVTWVVLSLIILAFPIVLKYVQNPESISSSSSSSSSMDREKIKLIEIILGLILEILSQNIFKEKSLFLMFAFLCFSMTWLGNLANVQPRTDLGIFHFFVSSTVETAASLFGIRVYTFLVFFGCVVLEFLRWKIDYVNLKHTGIKSGENFWCSCVRRLLPPPVPSPAVVVAPREGSEPLEADT